MNETKALRDLLGVYYDSHQEYYNSITSYLQRGIELEVESPWSATFNHKKNKFLFQSKYALKFSPIGFLLNYHNNQHNDFLFGEDTFIIGVGPKNCFDIPTIEIKIKDLLKVQESNISPKIFESQGKKLVTLKFFLKLKEKGVSRLQYEKELNKDINQQTSWITDKIKEGIRKGLHYNFKQYQRALDLSKNKRVQELWETEFSPYIFHLNMMGINVRFDYKKDNWDSLLSQIESPGFIQLPSKDLSIIELFLEVVQSLQYSFGHGSKDYSFKKEWQKKLTHLENSRTEHLTKLGSYVKN